MSTGVHRSTDTTDTTREVAPIAWSGIVPVMLFVTAATVFAASRYHLFGDELYFIVAGHRPSVSYADQGPALPLLASAMDWLSGRSLIVFRLPGIIATVGATLVTALIAREMGGGRWPQIAAAAAFATSPLLLLQAHTLATNTFDASLWTVITWLVARWVRTREDHLLLIAGIVTAVDLQVKWLVPVLWVALGVGLVVCGPRSMLRRPALWGGAAIAVLTAVPGLVWQAAHGWPQIGLGGAVAAEEGGSGGRLMFVPTLLIYAGVLGAVLAIYGLWQLFRLPALRHFRFFAVAFLVTLVVFVAAGGRPYYPAGLLAAVFAAGAVGLEHQASRRSIVAAGAITAAAVISVAFALPWTPESRLTPTDSETRASSQITVYGEFGWPALAEHVAKAWQTQLHDDPHDAPAAVVTASYWQASALEYAALGTAGGLPVFSPDRGFGFFGTPPDSAHTVLYVGATTSPPTAFCANVEPLHSVRGGLGFPSVSTDVTIWRCSATHPWSQVWPGLRHM